MLSKPPVLMIDDDPGHLRIYCWILEAAGYDPLPALVTRDGIQLPGSSPDFVILDYRLNSEITAVQAAGTILSRYPGTPIILFSDTVDLPTDIAPYIKAFVRKGDPARLVETLAG